MSDKKKTDGSTAKEPTVKPAPTNQQATAQQVKVQEPTVKP